MKWTIIVVLACGLTVGAADKPSPVPTTMPTLLSTAALEAKVDAAREVIGKVKAEARARLEASADYQAMKASVAAKRAALDEARKGEDSRAKLDASGAFNTAKAKLSKADTEIEGTLAGVAREEAAAFEAAKRDLLDVQRQNQVIAGEIERFKAEEKYKAAPPVTYRELNLAGDKYNGKILRMNGRFVDAFDPKKTPLFERMSRVLGRDENDDFRSILGFSITDENGDVVPYVVANRDRWLDVVAALKQGQEVAIAGQVVDVELMKAVVFRADRIWTLPPRTRQKPQPVRQKA